MMERYQVPPYLFFTDVGSSVGAPASFCTFFIFRGLLGFIIALIHYIDYLTSTGHVAGVLLFQLSSFAVRYSTSLFLQWRCARGCSVLETAQMPRIPDHT